MSLGDKYYARLQLWGKTKEEWNSENPILRLNEIGIESDTRQFKIGDGKTPWVQLQYYYPKKISSTDGSTVSLSSNRIEIVNSDGSHQNTKSAFTSYRTYFEGENGKKAWFDLNELYLLNKSSETMITADTVRVSDIAKTSFTQINQSHIKTQKDVNNYVQYGWDSVSNRPYFQMTKDDTVTNFFGYDSNGPFYRMISLGGENLVESSSTIILPGMTCDFTYDENFVTYLIKLPHTDGGIKYSTNFNSDGYDIGWVQQHTGTLIETEDGYNFDTLNEIGELAEFDAIQNVETIANATYIAFDFPIEKITGLIIQQGAKVVEAGTSYLRPAGLTLKSDTGVELALNFNSSTDANPYLLFSDASKNKVRIGLEKLSFYTNGTQTAWFQSNELRISTGNFRVQASTQSDRSILKIENLGTSSAVQAQMLGSGASLQLINGNTTTGKKILISEEIIQYIPTGSSEAKNKYFKILPSSIQISGDDWYDNGGSQRLDLTHNGLKLVYTNSYDSQGKPIYDDNNSNYFLTPAYYSGTAQQAHGLTGSNTIRIYIKDRNPNNPNFAGASTIYSGTAYLYDLSGGSYEAILYPGLNGGSCWY